MATEIQRKSNETWMYVATAIVVAIVIAAVMFYAK
jgi:uncharacterized membrane protein YidH (DUF202 family)